MKLEDYLEIWEKDSDIDRTELGAESLRAPKLHQKYYVFFSQERKKLREMEVNLKRLRLRKHEFYLHGHDEITRRLGWQLPPAGKVTLKSDVEKYVDTDEHVVAAAMEVGTQQETVNFLESCLRSPIAFWNKTIENAINWSRFTAGG